MPDRFDAVGNPIGAYCPFEHKDCEAVSKCQFRAHNAECLIKQAAIRLLGTQKRFQRMLCDFGRILAGTWSNEREPFTRHDQKCFDAADRD